MALPLYWVALWSFLTAAIVPLITRIMASLGLAFITYQGVDVGLQFLRDQAQSALGGITGPAIDIIKMMQIDVAFTLIASAVLVKLTLGGLTGGSIKRFGFK